MAELLADNARLAADATERASLVVFVSGPYFLSFFSNRFNNSDVSKDVFPLET